MSQKELTVPVVQLLEESQKCLPKRSCFQAQAKQRRLGKQLCTGRCREGDASQHLQNCKKDHVAEISEAGLEQILDQLVGHGKGL